MKKFIASVLSVTTSLWLTGVLALVPVVNAATIIDGDVIQNPNADGAAKFDVYIVKHVGAKKFKRLVLNPQVFESYGHLSWSKIKQVTQAEMDQYTLSDLVRADGDSKVYHLIPDGDTGTKKWVDTLDCFNSSSYDWDAVYIINGVDRDNYTTAATTQCGTVIPTDGNLSITLAADSPAGGYVALGSYDNTVAKINFTAGSAAMTVSKIAVYRDGLAEDNDILNIKIYDGTTQLGSTQAVNSTTHKATFSGLSWVIPANTTKTLTVKSSINTSGNGGTSGNIPAFGISAAADVTVSSGSIVGTFPVFGANFNIAGISVGQLDVDTLSTPAAGDVISGTTDQYVATFKFDASATEGFNVNSIKLTEVGTSVDTDVANIKIKVGGVQVGSTVSALSNGAAVFSGSPLFAVAAGTNKEVHVYVDVANGVTSQRTIKFEVTDSADVVAIGQNSSGSVLITHNSGTAFAAEQSQTQTIKQGTLTVTFDPDQLSAQTYIIGTEQAELAKFKFSAGSNEGIVVTKFRITENGAAGDTDYSNVKLYTLKDGVETDLGFSGSVSSNVITFENTGGLFNVPKSDNTTVVVKADISTAAAGTDALKLSLEATTDLKIKGEVSQVEIQNDSTNITLTSVAAANATQHEIDAYGTLTVANAPDTTSAKTYALGTTNMEFMKFRLTAASEAMRVTSVKVRMWDDSDAPDGSDTAASTADFTNAKLYDGSTLLNEQSSVPSGVVTFNFNLDIAKDSTKTLTVVVDVPTASTANYLSGSVGAFTGDTSSIVTGDDMTTTGISSSADITETGSAIGALMTKGAPTLTVSAAGTPPAHTVVTSATDHTVGRINLTASTAEAIKVSSIEIRTATSSTLALSSANTTASAVFSNIKIFNANTGTQIGTTKQLTDGVDASDYAIFSGITLEVPAGETLPIDIKADVVGTTAGPWYFGLSKATDPITSTGKSSGTTTDLNDDDTSDWSSDYVACPAVTITSVGTLTVSVDADTPTGKNIAVGSTAGSTQVEVARVKFEATNESIKVKKLRFTAKNAEGEHANFGAVKIYDGATVLASSYAVDDGADADNSSDDDYVEFNAATGSYLFEVPVDGSKVIIVKADLVGTSNGTNSGDDVRLYIVDETSTTHIDAVGSSSGTAMSGTAGTPAVSTETNFRQLYLYKSAPTLALNSASPSGTQTAGTNAEVMRFDVTADSKADVVLNNLALTVSGNVDISAAGTGDAYLYKSTDLTTPVARETYKAVTGVSLIASGDTATSTAAGFDSIPVGANVYVDSDTATDDEICEVTSITVSGSIATMTLSCTVGPSGSNAGIGADSNAVATIYYRPAYPGTGKIYFGGQDVITATSSTYVDVASTEGFATGDTVTIKGWTMAGVANTCTETIAQLSATRITFDGTPTCMADLDLDYAGTGLKSSGNAIIYVTDSANANGTDFINETVSAGATKTFIVKADTTGATATESLRFDIAAIADFNWDDTLRFGVTTLTTGLPLLGNTLNY